MTPAAITIVLDDKRKRLGLWWQKLQHAVGGVPLLIAGVHRLQTPGGGGDLLAIAEIAVAAILLVLLARDLRSEAAATRRTPAPGATHSHAHAGPNWFDVVAGALLILVRRYRNADEIRAAFVQWDAARALPDAS